MLLRFLNSTHSGDEIAQRRHLHKVKNKQHSKETKAHRVEELGVKLGTAKQRLLFVVFFLALATAPQSKRGVVP